MTDPNAYPPFPLRLIAGEAVCVTFPHVYLLALSRASVEGLLYITNYRLVWAPLDRDAFDDVEVPLMTIWRIEKVGGKATKSITTYVIEIHCKDIRILRFGFDPERSRRKQVFEHLRSVCFSSTVENTFAFSNHEEHADAVDGWTLYQHEKEFRRMGALGDSSKWRLCTLNAQFAFSETYPTAFVVPNSVSDDQLSDVAAFRSKARIPVLSWYNARNGTAITRSAQPLVGILRASSQADQALLEAIFHASSHTEASKLLIVDLRPRANAVANQAKGAGFESAAHYSWCELRFMNIENIHVMRDSFRRVMELSLGSGGADVHWASLLESTQWLEHIRNIVATARVLAEAIERGGQSVLAHCSDGWDRTAQVVSLAMLMLDAYYRTMEGFAVLVEKEWIAFGHRFATRTGHGAKNWWHDQGCPVFLQFLDAVFQLLAQFPTHFEFTEAFLCAVADHLYSCRFGTFLCDNEAERVQKRVREQTVSLWTVLLAPKNRKRFLNPFYVRPRAMNAGDTVVLPDASHVRLQFWDRYFLRFCRRLAFDEVYMDGFDASERLLSRGREMCEHIAQLEESNAMVMHSNMTTVQTFQREIMELHRKIIELQQEKDALMMNMSTMQMALSASAFSDEDGDGDGDGSSKDTTFLTSPPEE